MHHQKLTRVSCKSGSTDMSFTVQRKVYFHVDCQISVLDRLFCAISTPEPIPWVTGTSWHSLLAEGLKAKPILLRRIPPNIGEPSWMSRMLKFRSCLEPPTTRLELPKKTLVVSRDRISIIDYRKHLLGLL